MKDKHERARRQRRYCNEVVSAQLIKYQSSQRKKKGERNRGKNRKKIARDSRTRFNGSRSARTHAYMYTLTRTSRATEFSLLRERNEPAIPSDRLHLHGCRTVHSSLRVHEARSRKRLSEFAPTARHWWRPNINIAYVIVSSCFQRFIGREGG